MSKLPYIKSIGQILFQDADVTKDKHGRLTVIRKGMKPKTYTRVCMNGLAEGFYVETPIRKHYRGK